MKPENSADFNMPPVRYIKLKHHHFHNYNMTKNYIFLIIETLIRIMIFVSVQRVLKHSNQNEMCNSLSE